MPTGPSSAGVGPDSIEARLRLGLEGLVGYEHRPGVVAEGADGVVVTEHTEVWTWETGETVALPFVSVQHIEDGVIVLWKDYWDFQTLVGAAPAAWHDRRTPPTCRGWSTSPVAPDRVAPVTIRLPPRPPL